jgi:hypothetical protein
LCNDEKFGSDFAHEETGKDKMRTGVSCARERERPGMMITLLVGDELGLGEDSEFETLVNTNFVANTSCDRNP